MVREQLNGLDCIELYQAYLRCWTDYHGKPGDQRLMVKSDITIGSDN